MHVKQNKEVGLARRMLFRLQKVVLWVPLPEYVVQSCYYTANNCVATIRWERHKMFQEGGKEAFTKLMQTIWDVEMQYIQYKYYITIRNLKNCLYMIV